MSWLPGASQGARRTRPRSFCFEFSRSNASHGSWCFHAETKFRLCAAKGHRTLCTCLFSLHLCPDAPRPWPSNERVSSSLCTIPPRPAINAPTFTALTTVLLTLAVKATRLMPTSPGCFLGVLCPDQYGQNMEPSLRPPNPVPALPQPLCSMGIWTSSPRGAAPDSLSVPQPVLLATVTPRRSTPNMPQTGGP